MFAVTGFTAQNAYHISAVADPAGIHDTHLSVGKKDFDLADAGSGLGKENGEISAFGE